jgi:hypothetical protein
MGRRLLVHVLSGGLRLSWLLCIRAVAEAMKGDLRIGKTIAVLSTHGASKTSEIESRKRLFFKGVSHAEDAAAFADTGERVYGYPDGSFDRSG